MADPSPVKMPPKANSKLIQPVKRLQNANRELVSVSDDGEKDLNSSENIARTIDIITSSEVDSENHQAGPHSSSKSATLPG